MKLRESSVKRTGGRAGPVISAQKAWKMGHEMSGSRAPSSQSRASVVFSGSGIGRLWDLVTWRVWRTLLDFWIWARKLAV